MKKKVISIILVLAVILPLFALPVSAQATQSTARFNVSAVTLGVGEKFYLWLIQRPENMTQRPTRRSSDPKVVTVSDGGLMITAVAEGTATVTEYIDGVAVASVRVTVRPAPERVRVEDITIAAGETQRLRIFYPRGTARSMGGLFVSKDNKVAQVSNGVLMGLGEGTTTVTLTLYNGVKTTFNVTVTAPSKDKPVVPDFIVGKWIMTTYVSNHTRGGSMTFYADGTGEGTRPVTETKYNFTYTVNGNDLIIYSSAEIGGEMRVEGRGWTITNDRTQIFNQTSFIAYTKQR
ncbi:MAG: hypothetical protein FWH08_00155 [Oscillospiraceae bacterium]|nr:hypothetical protein [Oscillospiraceae bacterium]